MHVLKYLCLAELPNKWQTDNLVSTSWSVVCLWYLGSFRATSCNKNKIDSKKDLPCLVVLWQRPQFWKHMFNEPSVRALSREWQDSVLPPPPHGVRNQPDFFASQRKLWLPSRETWACQIVGALILLMFSSQMKYVGWNSKTKITEEGGKILCNKKLELKPQQ